MYVKVDSEEDFYKKALEYVRRRYYKTKNLANTPILNKGTIGHFKPEKYPCLVKFSSETREAHEYGGLEWEVFYAKAKYMEDIERELKLLNAN